jgi:hypothetical protein
MSASRLTAAEALTLTQQMMAECTKALIDWGDAMRRAEDAEVDGDEALQKATKLHAKVCGMRMIELAMGISAALHPNLGGMGGESR